MKIREQAVKTLLRVSREGAYSNLETKKVLGENHYKEEDRGLYLNIVYGTLQNKLYLDYLSIQLKIRHKAGSSLSQYTFNYYNINSNKVNNLFSILP